METEAPGAVIKVSFYPEIKATTNGAEVDLLFILRKIKEGRWKDLIEKLRKEDTAAGRRELKKQLPYFTPSGIFSTRSEQGLKMHSGIIAMDIDYDLSKREEIAADPYTFACVVSAGGQGFFTLVKVSTNNHLGTFRALEKRYKEKYGVKVDSLPDVSRPRFVSYDPDLYLNLESKIFEEVLTEPAKPSIVHPKIAPMPILPGNPHGARVLQLMVKKIRDCHDGDKNKTLNRAAFLGGGYVATGFLSEDEVIQTLEQAIAAKPNVVSLPEAYKTIRAGVTAGKTKPILPDFYQQMIYGSKKRQEYKETVIQKISAITGIKEDLISPAVNAAYQEEDSAIETFWVVTHDEKKDAYRIKINKAAFLKFLNDNGFWQFRGYGGCLIVRVNNGAVEEIDLVTVKRFVIDYLESLPFAFDNVLRSTVIEAYLDESIRLCDIKFLQSLPLLTEPFLKADSNNAYFYFLNGYATVTGTTIAFKDYSSLPALIWEHQIIKRPFEVMDLDEVTENCEFYQFCFKVTGEDNERITVLMHAIGYLLHQHRSRTNYAAIILSDQGGRTGKGIIGQALGHMKKVVKIDGRNVDLNRQFALQKVTQTTELVFIDDADPKRIPFERIFSWLTEGIEVEYKLKGAFDIAFDNAPKFLITSNFVFDGATASHEGRKVEIELAPYYSLAFTPANEFGHELFTGWEDKQWQLFYNFMLLCCQLYMVNGLARYKSASLQRKKLIQATNEDFVIWADEVFSDIKLESEFSKKYLWEAFLSHSGFTDKTLPQRKFTGWVKDYLHRHGAEVKDCQIRTGPIREEIIRVVACPEPSP